MPETHILSEFDCDEVLAAGEGKHEGRAVLRASDRCVNAIYFEAAGAGGQDGKCARGAFVGEFDAISEHAGRPQAAVKIEDVNGRIHRSRLDAIQAGGKP